MQYTVPEKLSDGRYYVRLSEPYYVTLPNVTIGESSGDMIVNGSSVADKIGEIDRQLVDDAVANSESWFNKVVSKETISTYFQSALEDQNTLTVSPVTNSKGKVNIGFFGENKDPLTEPPQPGTVCNVLVQLDGLWFLRRSFGPAWKIVQVRVKKQVQPIKCLIPDSDSE